MRGEILFVMHRFHIALNRMTLFTTLVCVGVIYFYPEFMQLATGNVWLNGVIIGTTIFGIGLTFVQMLKLAPEYKWLHNFTDGHGRAKLKLPPYLLRPVAQILVSRPRQISATLLGDMLDVIQIRFEDLRESVQYITNLLIFLGLLGTFWGLILTVGGFTELIGNLDFADENVLLSMQAGMAKPLMGITTAFTSSLLGLAGSLIVGFLGLQVQVAQNAIFRELTDYLSAKTHIDNIEDIVKLLPQINSATNAITNSIKSLENKISDD